MINLAINLAINLCGSGLKAPNGKRGACLYRVTISVSFLLVSMYHYNFICITPKEIYYASIASYKKAILTDFLFFPPKLVSHW